VKAGERFRAVAIFLISLAPLACESKNEPSAAPPPPPAAPALVVPSGGFDFTRVLGRTEKTAREALRPLKAGKPDTYRDPALAGRATKTLPFEVDSHWSLELTLDRGVVVMASIKTDSGDLTAPNADVQKILRWASLPSVAFHSTKILDPDGVERTLPNDFRGSTTVEGQDYEVSFGKGALILRSKKIAAEADGPNPRLR